MKIYTNTIDLANPSDKKFWVAPYSDFAIGIKFVANGEDVEGTVVLKDRNGNAMTANAQKYGDGFTVFKTSSSEGEKTDVYTAVAPNGQQIQIIQNTSDSTVFDIDEAGEEFILPQDLNVNSVTAKNLSIDRITLSEPSEDGCYIEGKSITETDSNELYIDSQSFNLLSNSKIPDEDLDFQSSVNVTSYNVSLFKAGNIASSEEGSIYGDLETSIAPEGIQIADYVNSLSRLVIKNNSILFENLDTSKKITLSPKLMEINGLYFYVLASTPVSPPESE